MPIGAHNCIAQGVFELAREISNVLKDTQSIKLRSALKVGFVCGGQVLASTDGLQWESVCRTSLYLKCQELNIYSVFVHNRYLGLIRNEVPF